MHIDEYISMLDGMTAQEMEDKYLMQSNFPILLNTKIIEWVDIHLPKANFRFTRSVFPYFDEEEKEKAAPREEFVHRFIHTTGVYIQAFGWLAPDMEPCYGRSFSDYNSTISLHPDQKIITAASGLEYPKANLETFKEIYRIAREVKAPFCLPETTKRKLTNGLVIYQP
jgi:hypothetical protein